MTNLLIRDEDRPVNEIEEKLMNDKIFISDNAISRVKCEPVEKIVDYCNEELDILKKHYKNTEDFNERNDITQEMMGYKNVLWFINNHFPHINKPE